MNKFPKTDWHCHILPGIDDGPRTMDESLAMVELLVQAGYAEVHCTPHLIRGCYEADNATVRRGVEALQGELDRRGIALRLFPGREYYIDEFLAEYLNDPLTLGDSRFLLIEVPARAPADFIKESFYRITSNGYTPMIAHPERCRLLDLPAPASGRLWDMLKVFKSTSNVEHRTLHSPSNSLLDYLMEIGCAFQGNLGSFTGRYGERVKLAAKRLREGGLYTHFGSDAHGVEHIRDL